MKTATINPSFEVDITSLVNPTSVIAVVQYINTLAKGEILKVTASNKNTIMAVISFCKNSGNDLLQKEDVGNEITLFIKKN